MKELSARWKEHYDGLAKEAASDNDGAFAVLGAIKARLEINAEGRENDDDTLSHIRYLIKAYTEARWK